MGSLISFQEEIQEKEKYLEEKENQLKVTLALFSEVFRGKSQDGEVSVLAEQIMLWRRQALALGRSAQHLEKIDLFVEKAKDNLMGKVSIPIRDCGAMLIDGREFTNLAFELIVRNEADKKP